jgi:molybdate/tungstate transport system permease protein
VRPSPAAAARRGTGAWRPALRLAPVFGALTLGLLTAPFVTLIFVTDWSGLRFAPGDGSAAMVSLAYSFVSIPLVVCLGTPLAWWLARSDFRGKWLAEALLLLPLLTPPLAMGMLLMSLFGPYSAAGSALAQIGLVLTNSAGAFILAQTYAATPYFVVTARAAFEGVPRDLEQVALTLGKQPWQVFFEVTLPLSALGLAAGLALAWVRALGEFGIVLIVAYYPQGIPVKLWVNLQDIGLSAVYPLLWLFFVVALPIPLWLGMASRRRTLS